MEIYKNPQYSIEERARNLLSLMTLDEKIDQMHCHTDPVQRYDEIRRGTAKTNFGFMNSTKEEYKSFLPKIQKYAVEKTRLGIPHIICEEGLHGLIYRDATVFPQNIGMACSFDEDILYEIGKEVGRAARGRGIMQIFAPDLDVAREPRWGRVQETYGEDPYLIGKLASAYVRGLQSQGVAATLKHFIGYSTPESGLNCSAGHLGEREIREVMLPPYEECIKAGACCVMPAYNELDGEPLHSSKKYLRDVLRDELGFEGMVISDWSGVIWNYNYHHIAPTPWQAGKYAIEAGVDVEAPECECYGEEFKNKVRSGEIPEQLVDKAVLNILRLKFKLGLFDGGAIWKRAPIRTSKSVALARRAAEESIVLLKNNGILPLDKEKKQKIAVIGPNADRAQMGDYCAAEEGAPYCVSPYSALVSKLGAEYVSMERGCEISHLTGEESLDRAVLAAKEADIVVLVLGDQSISKPGGAGGGKKQEAKREPLTDGEGYDVTSLELMSCQKELFARITSLGKPVITVLYTGRPRVIVNEVQGSDAFIQAWYPGEQGGTALADILFGDVNPSGKLSVSLPRSAAAIPCFYNHHISSRGAVYGKPGSHDNPGRDYVFDLPESFMPFGFGLSYTEYKYSNLKVKAENGRAEVRVTVENTGKYDGTETVLIFMRHKFSEAVPFIKELKSFKRIKLKAGEKRTVRFILSDDAFTVIGRDCKKHFNSGVHYITVADQCAEFYL